MSTIKEEKRSPAAAASPSNSEKRSTGNGNDSVVKIFDITEISTPKDKRPSNNTTKSNGGARIKILNNVAASGGTKSTKGSPSPKQDRRLNSSGARIKILNDAALIGTPKAEKRNTGSNNSSAGKNTSPGSAAVKILNEKRMVPAVTPAETTKIKTSPTKKKNMDHYVLQAVKTETNKADTTCTVVVEDDETIDFIITSDNELEMVDGKEASANEITQEFAVSDDEEFNPSEAGERRTSPNEDPNDHICGKCYKSFRRNKSLKKHLEFCRFDSGYHIRKQEMQKNLDKIEKDAVAMEKKDICFCCSESYDTFHLGHINCPDCPKSFKTQTSYERHIFITHSDCSDFPCSICNAKLPSAALLKLHEEQHKIRGKPYACKICGKDFTRSYHLKRHQKYSSCSANESDTMSCKVCDRVFYRLDNLRAHLKQHLGTQVVKKPEYMCHVCKNCFYSLSTLNIHIRTHTGEKPFDCDLCDKKFSALVALKKHRRYHTGEKPYSCTVCSQSFAVKEVLNRHMKRHTGERPHKCKECGKSFIQATQLRTHSKTHLRPFPCELCEEKFKTEKQLERHVKEHNRQKRSSFHCNECKNSFRTADLLQQHIDKGIHTPKPTRAKRTAKVVIERTDCAICDKNFDSTETLRTHIRNVHECNPDDIFGTTESQPPSAKRTKKGNTTNSTEDGDAARGSLISANTSKNGVVVREYLVDEGDGNAQSIVLEDATYTILPLDEDRAATSTEVKPENKTQVKPVFKREQRKSLAASLAAAIADDDEDDTVTEEDFNGEVLTEDDLKLKANVAKLIDMLVDPPTLKKYGWPKTTEETVLCKIIENCGHDLSKGSHNYAEMEYGLRMREYAKLLFTVVVHNDSIIALLNNFSIDDVIDYVLGSDEQDNENSEDCKNEENDESDD